MSGRRARYGLDVARAWLERTRKSTRRKRGVAFRIRRAVANLARLFRQVDFLAASVTRFASTTLFFTVASRAMTLFFHKQISWWKSTNKSV